MVSAYATELGLVLGQEKVADKSNEITAIPELLEALAVRGLLVSIDAMGCQKTIAAAIRARGADYLLTVKANQPTLSEALEIAFVSAHDRSGVAGTAASKAAMGAWSDWPPACSTPAAWSIPSSGPTAGR